MKMSLKYALHDCTNTYEYINHRIQLLSCTCGLTDPAPVPHGVDLWCPILLGGLIACGFPLFRPERGKCVSGNEGITSNCKFIKENSDQASDLGVCYFQTNPYFPFGHCN